MKPPRRRWKGSSFPWAKEGAGWMHFLLQSPVHLQPAEWSQAAARCEAGGVYVVTVTIHCTWHCTALHWTLHCTALDWRVEKREESCMQFKVNKLVEDFQMFTPSAPLGPFSHRVPMSVGLVLCAIKCIFFARPLICPQVTWSVPDLSLVLPPPQKFPPPNIFFYPLTQKNYLDPLQKNVRRPNEEKKI